MDAILKNEPTVEEHFIALDDLIESAKTIDHSIALFEENDEFESTEEELYSMWLDQGGEYTPAVNLKTIDKIPNGVYKVVWKNDDYHVVPIKINTDELYRFTEDFTDIILTEVQKFWDKTDTYKKYNFTHKRGLLLAGSPGCGKTAIINLLIKQLIEKDGIVFYINNLKEFNIYTEVLKPVIRKIEPERPIITIIEDIDQLISNMNGNDSEILDLLDGKNSVEHHLIIMTSNNTSELSGALLRPSRVDMLFEVPAPSETIRKEFYQKKGVPENQINEFVLKTDGMSFAELKEVFIGTIVLGKDIDSVISQIKNPLETKDYLTKPKHQIGL